MADETERFVSELRRRAARGDSIAYQARWFFVFGGLLVAIAFVAMIAQLAFGVDRQGWVIATVLVSRSGIAIVEPPGRVDQRLGIGLSIGLVQLVGYLVRRRSRSASVGEVDKDERRPSGA